MNGRLPVVLPLVRATAMAALAAVSAAAGAATPAGGGIYTCINDRGQRLTSDRPIPECTAKEQHLLNRDGSVRAVVPPTLTADERAEKEARERKAAEVRAAQQDAVRRDRNLMQRFPNEAAHDKARQAALDTVRIAIKATENRMRDLQAERKPLMDESEFYVGRRLPAKLKQQIDANDAAMEAQRNAQQQQQAELARINRLFDAELERLKLLWSGVQPGSLGPIGGAPGNGGSAPGAGTR